MRNLVLAGVVFVVAMGNCFAEQTIGPVAITRIRTGWNSDTFVIETNQPIANPANCEFPDGYASTLSDSGFKTHYAATLTAFALGKPVDIVVSSTECTEQRPKIWGVYLEP